MKNYILKKEKERLLYQERKIRIFLLLSLLIKLLKSIKGERKLMNRRLTQHLNDFF